MEAVIEIRARPADALEETSLRTTIEPNLAGYVFLDSLREFQGEVKFEGGKVSSQRVQDTEWRKGVRFRSSDGKHIAQFNRDGFVFNRLEPYLSWEELENESKGGTFIKIWPNPSISNVLGSGYINRIKLPPGELLFEDYIQPAPSSPHGFGTAFPWIHA